MLVSEDAYLRMKVALERIAQNVRLESLENLRKTIEA